MEPSQPTDKGLPTTKETGRSEGKLPENLYEALVDAFRPIIRELDIVVEETRNSQQDAKRQIDLLSDEIYRISMVCDLNPTLEMYAKKMATIKRRVTVMHNILQNVRDRLRKLEHMSKARTDAQLQQQPASVIPGSVQQQLPTEQR